MNPTILVDQFQRLETDLGGPLYRRATLSQPQRPTRRGAALLKALALVRHPGLHSARTRATALATAPAGPHHHCPENLRRAVHGQRVSTAALGEGDAVPAGWPWLDAELGSILTTTPTAVAALLATLCLDTGDLDGALAATQIGLSVLPAHRGLFAVRMRVRAATSDLSAVRVEYEAYLRAETADPLTDGETDRDLERLYLTLVRSQSGH